MRQDFELVREAVRSVLPHGKFFSSYVSHHAAACSMRVADGGRLFVDVVDSGALGAGLAILSRFPLLESTTIPYHLTGRPLGFSDFYVNKAAGSIMIDHPTIGEMDIYTTHVSCSVISCVRRCALIIPLDPPLDARRRARGLRARQLLPLISSVAAQ